MGLKDLLLNEAELSDTLESAEITFDSLVSAVLASDDKKIHTGNMTAIATALGIGKPELTKCVEQAKSLKFLNASGTVAAKYAKTASGKVVKAGAKKPAAAEEDTGSGGGSVSSGGSLSKSLDGRVTKFIAPPVTNNNLFSHQVGKLLSMMSEQSGGGSKHSYLLAGDPGVGKTSFSRNIAKILGVPLIIIEAPHITEEHIVNIPFMILKNDSLTKDSAVLEIDSAPGMQAFEIVQAESNLVSKIKGMGTSKLDDRQHLMNIAKDQGLRDVYKQYRELINKVRGSYNCLLFLDEFYRVDSVKIRNILRNILNGRIGNDKIPSGTFIFYASNLNDAGVSEIPMNHEFMKMEFQAPDKDQWFNYVLTKYEENENKDHPAVKLQEPVFNKFYQTFSSEDLNFKDEDNEVRSSPRRWEQLLLYVNQNLPVANVKEAKVLMANIEVNFRNYLNGNTSSLYPKVKQMMIELVKETSNVDFDGSSHPADEWKDTMQQQIATKIAMDSESKNGKEARKYVPVVSGEPGVGKTSYFSQIADELDLHFIHVDVSSLNRDSTTGIPKATQAKDDDGNPLFDQNNNPVMKTEFSKPQLLITIENLIRDELEREKKLPEDKRKKGKGKYKFLLLFDELTRANPAVFNTIRKVLLEKSFNEDFDLPEDIMVAGALNPSDSAEGVSELTEHMRDVVDVIPARANWTKTEAYILKNVSPPKLNEELGFDCNAATVEAVTALLDHYKTRSKDWKGEPIRREERMFNMEDDADVVYISPRAITDLVSTTNGNIRDMLLYKGIAMTNTVQEIGTRGKSSDDFLAMIDAEDAEDKGKTNAKKGIYDKSNSNYSNEDYEQFIKSMITVFRDIWAEKLGFICSQQDVDPGNITSVTTGYIMKDESVRKPYDRIRAKENKEIPTISKMFDTYYDNPEELFDSPHFDNYLAANSTSPIGLIQEMTDYLANKVGDLQKLTGSGTITVKNNKGEDIQFSKQTAEFFDLYLKFMSYVKVILSVLTTKTKHVERVKEAERTGQYFTNLHIALTNIGKEFLDTHQLAKVVVNQAGMDVDRFNKVRTVVLAVKKILTDAGFGKK